MENINKSLLSLLQTVKQDCPIDIMFKESFLGRNLVVIGKTAEWLLQQNAFSSVYQLMGMEIESYTIKNNRYTIILK